MNEHELFEAHIPWVKILARSYAKNHRLQHADADDCYNEGLLEMYLCTKRFKPGESQFTSFAQMRVRGAFRDVMRRKGIRKFVHGVPIFAGYITVPDEEMDRPVDRRQRLSVPDILEFLPPGRSRVVFALLADGWRKADIARAFKVSAATVTLDVSAARAEAVRSMRKFFDGYIRMDLPPESNITRRVPLEYKRPRRKRRKRS